MMPTNESGPASDTAAPVASDALASAIFSARGTFTPRAAADSAPTLSRSSTRGKVAKPAHARVNGTSAAPIGPYDPTSSDPISHRTVWSVCVKSARYRTNVVNAPSSVVSVTPASSRTVLDAPRRRAAESPYTMPRAPSEPKSVANGMAERPSSEKSALKVMASTAPSAAPADTPRVSGEASGLRNSA